MFRPRILNQVGSARLRFFATCLVCFAPVCFTMIAAAADQQKHVDSAVFMGTKWHLVLYSCDANSANEATKAAWQVVGEIDKALTNYAVDSELNQLCRGAPQQDFVPVSDHLWTVLRAADQLSRKTDGAFDVTIGPVSKLWRRARKKKHMPDQARLTQAKRAVGYQFVQFSESTQAVKLTRPAMQLDLGGIAKGYAVDRALEAITQQGITSALVNGGGDLAASSPPPGAAAWTIDVAGLNPKKEPEPISIANAAIATSGDAWQFLTIDGTRYSHLIDARTGIGTTQRASVSVVAKTCMTADAWASALCVLDIQTGLKLLQNEADLQAKIVALDDSLKAQTYRTAGFPMLPIIADDGR